MGNIFKNKFFIILLIVICVLTLSTIILNLAGYASVVADFVNLFLTPFSRFADILKESFGGFTAYFSEFNRMKEEIADLKSRLAVAEALNEDTRKLQEQNDMLASFYELKRENIDYMFQPAKVTAKSPGNYLSVLTINKGSFHNIERDMPVIAATETDYIIVGYVFEVGITSSKVMPFIRTGEAVGAYIKRTEELGIVEGRFELERYGLGILANLSKDASVEDGDKLYTSGSGSRYPENLYIGEVVEVEGDPFSQTMTGLVKPAVNFGEIKEVMVILKFDRKFD
ncbi:MAG: rod shape-determining protein MreC [Oscillospiraceae bacterium]|nr:rod shape-determining protein MreC [Oscillospiraceae bacterium]